MGTESACSDSGFYPGVVVDEITPNYYAATTGGIAFKFDIVGQGFPLIPNDAIGVMSEDNDNPLLRKDTTDPVYMLPIVDRTANTMTLTSTAVAGHGVPYYLGAIVSADRNVVYWINDSKPLP